MTVFNLKMMVSVIYNALNLKVIVVLAVYTFYSLMILLNANVFGFISFNFVLQIVRIHVTTGH